MQGGSSTSEQVVRPTMKERQRQFREEAILDAALVLLKTKGYDAMTLEDITEAIGISRPTLYLHFRSKEDVVMHLSFRCRRDLFEFITNQDRSKPASERLIAFCDFALDMRFGSQALAFGDMMKVISSMANPDPELTELENRLMDAYVALAVEAQAEGNVRRDISALAMSQVIVGLIKNYAFDALIESGKISIDEIKDCARKLMLPPG